ncbi:hypothetical protein [Mesorhizobium sophorae]|uniref:hypothetical protein n=1 Tax=Mesorhizobium sophorae TaxID=1300294 RepID=UPI000BA4B252|nr:hypothetical protein [Mesorhizobium sophorae]
MSSKSSSSSYQQPTKEAARRKAISRAVKLVTTRRANAAVVPADHITRIRTHLLTSDAVGDFDVAMACDTADIKSWRRFRSSVIGTRKASEISVAYLAGPEPSNDLQVFLECGVRPENIWAFEDEKKTFASGLGNLRQTALLRGVKFVPISIEDYFTGTPRRFDVIYLDACGPLPSQDQKTTRLLANLFRHSALAPLGVLITNFARPDVSSDQKMEPYAHLVSSYLYPKSFLDAPGGGITGGAQEHGLMLRNDNDQSESFYHEVAKNFDHYYGTFITRHIFDIAALIAPLARLANSKLLGLIFKGEVKQAAERGERFVRFKPDVYGDNNAEESDEASSGSSQSGYDISADLEGAPAKTESDDDVSADGLKSEMEQTEMDGDAIIDPPAFSLLWTFAACGYYASGSDFDEIPADCEKFLNGWLSQLYGTPTDKKTAPDIVAAYYAWRHDTAFRSEAMRELSSYPYQEKMPFLCDVPTQEIGLYPAFAQIAYPAHCNIREAKRYQYVAEGKTASMYLDVLPFDECRYVYDWLSALHLIPDDWNDLSAQLTFRFALDGIAKENRWYGEDFLFGCHVVGESQKFPMSELGARSQIKIKTTKSSKLSSLGSG